uniref:Anaphase-promoting complex subunit 4-like WD40 domain-containing protein n=1 Tax=Arcella intermedia TaxID=1963864 RepID=A0A6B2LBY2_9EUKA
MITCGRDSSIRQWTLNTNHSTIRHHLSYEHHSDWVNDILMLNQNYLLSCSSDTTLNVWGVGSPRVLHSFTKHQDYVKALASPYATVAPFKPASAGLDGNVFIWDFEKQQAENLFTMGQSNNSASIYSLVMSGNGDMVAIGTSTKRVKVYDIKSGKKIISLKEHVDNVKALLTDTYGKVIVSGTVLFGLIGILRCYCKVALMPPLNCGICDSLSAVVQPSKKYTTVCGRWLGITQDKDSYKLQLEMKEESSSSLEEEMVLFTEQTLKHRKVNWCARKHFPF